MKAGVILAVLDVVFPAVIWVLALFYTPYVTFSSSARCGAWILRWRMRHGRTAPDSG